jgi:hypothetical protein
MLDIFLKVSYAYSQIERTHPSASVQKTGMKGPGGGSGDRSKESGWCKDTLDRSSPAPERMEAVMEFLAECLVTVAALLIAWRWL